MSIEAIAQSMERIEEAGGRWKAARRAAGKERRAGKKRQKQWQSRLNKQGGMSPGERANVVKDKPGQYRYDPAARKAQEKAAKKKSALGKSGRLEDGKRLSVEVTELRSAADRSRPGNRR